MKLGDKAYSPGLLLALFLAAGAVQAQIPAGNVQTFIPHSVAGGGFLTRVFITNLSTVSNNLTVNRIDQSGNVVESTAPTLSPGGTILIADTEAERTQDVTVTWFAIASQESISASVLFDFDSQALGLEENFRTAVGSLSAEPLVAFTAPVRVATVEVTVGLALANLTGESNEVNLQLLDQNGTVLAQDSFTLGPFSQTAFSIQDRAAFRDIVLGSEEFIGSLAVSTTDASLELAALVVGNNLRELFALPVSAGVAAPIDVTVNMRNLRFDPRDLTVPAGSTVTWVNRDNVQHTATADDSNTFDTGVINPGGQGGVGVSSRGLVPYYCIFHGSPGGVGMAGTVTVQ